MNNYINVLTRSILEAITEFLPVSSTGHLFLFNYFFPFQAPITDPKFDDLFDIFIQSGAILSVVFLYWRYLLDNTLSATSFILKQTNVKYGIKFYMSIIAGSFPIMILGFLFKNVLNLIKENPNLLLIMGLAWIIGGIIIILVEKRFAHKEEFETANTEEITIRQAITIGMFQCIALIPGVSRSAATIICGRFLGLSKKSAAEYSFFLAIPVLIMAGLYKLYKYRNMLNAETTLILLAGFFISMFLCILVIKWFLIFIKKFSFEIFGYYRIALGIIVIVFFMSK